MPLLKKRPFALAAPPEDLRPDEEVWQVRFTNEIFRSYPEYLERMNLFRQRVWTCRVSGKMHLTYEEALVSEQQANQKLLQFPPKFMTYVLHKVQFSMLNMNEIVTMIVENLKDTFVEGEELLGRLENSDCPCKITKVLSCDGGSSYEVGWLNESGDVTATSVIDKDKLIRKKFPFSRGLLKLFIKESTSQNSPWVVHGKLAKKYGISTKAPKEIRDRITQNQKVGSAEANRKKGSTMSDASTSTKTVKTRKTDDNCIVVHDQTRKGTQRKKQQKVENIKYPIEDKLVKPSAEDPAFTTRPVPSDKFLIPPDTVGNFLMIWDFLSCFGKLLRLSPFSLDEFENAIVCEGISDLIIEAHTCILTLLVNDHGEYYDLIQQKKRKETITLKGWAQYLCDFLEFENETKFAHHIMKIKNGNYSMLGVHVKLEVLGELLHAAISTEAIRGQLDTFIEQQQALLVSKREEDMEELRKMREEKRLKDTKGGDQECLQEHDDLKGPEQSTSDSMHNHLQTDLVQDANIKKCSNGGSKIEVLTSRRALMKKNLEEKIAMEREKENLRLEELNRLREENKSRAKEAKEKKLKEQRLEHFEREMEKLHIRTNSLGKDREHNTYWFFQREGRLFVESADHNSWGYYSSKEELDALMGSLNPKGVRELSLQGHLQKHYLKICSAFQKRSKELVQRISLEDPAILRRSIRVSALPKDKNKVPSFLRYVNKWRT